ncbi:hypothetical protein [Candidatus Mycoplasma haematominutum]|uniref:Uncharacterized protein n=1 Tax=Candidatus Mycoplasma haematominutum 'Birmingham 1' TaxID=1116213 RepID=G8C3R2_9MOLU|nr:hypothetical protein [Candidatus Mycoplasma haematominutum]CCE66960.1 hypothetical protein MHM_04420 [Candidatus Mycoplasma haematominutum 'Birmingham 1']
MLVLFKLCLALVAVAGISAAVATPVVASATSAASVTREVGEVAGVEQVGSTRTTPKVEKCATSSTSGGTTITFGSSSTSTGVCWTSEGSDNLSADLSEIFSSTWNTPDKWVYSGSTGQTYCKNREDTPSEEKADTENNGLITLWKETDGSCSGTEYLELKGSSSQATTFLKKELSASGSASYNVWLCTENNCWDSSTPFKTAQSQQVVKEVGSAWKPVSFQ